MVPEALLCRAGLLVLVVSCGREGAEGAPPFPGQLDQEREVCDF